MRFLCAAVLKKNIFPFDLHTQKIYFILLGFFLTLTQCTFFVYSVRKKMLNTFQCTSGQLITIKLKRIIILFFFRMPIIISAYKVVNIVHPV